MKHSYLILAHNEWGLLQTLIDCIDDPRNDIFVHIDAKVASLPELRTERADLSIIDERVDVRWGDWTVVEAEYALFKAAVSKGKYGYYHLLSGVDLPLKSQDYIHDFFKRNEGNEFIGFSSYPGLDEELRRKVGYWHAFPGDFKNRSVLKRLGRAALLRAQILCGVHRHKDVEFCKGTQWVSVTDGFMRELLANEHHCKKLFTHTFCPDEIYKQTVCWDSAFKEHVFNIDNEARGCMRAIGWRNGQLFDWSAEDYEILASSEALFARKFNSSDPEFIDKIVKLSRND